MGRQYPSPETYDVTRVGPRGFPDVVQSQPGARRFALRAIAIDGLREDAVVVADAVPGGGELQRRQRIEKTGRETPETTIAEAWIDFELHHRFEVVAHALDGGPRLLDELGIETRERIDQRAAGQEFHRQVTKALDARARDTALSRKPTRGQFLVHAQR